MTPSAVAPSATSFAAPSPIASLYLHFPFCEAKCHYCDFYSLGAERTQASDPQNFETALSLEIKANPYRLAPELKTLFFGGGTPSMTDYDSMQRALTPLWQQTTVTAATEWSLEANPSSIALAPFQALRQWGLNRVSMGVQALKPDLLQLLGRVHSGPQALKALEIVFQAGFTNVSVDLLCGVPGQTEADLRQALTRLLAFPITHLSCYLLTLAPHHRLAPQLPDEEVQLRHLLLVDQVMSEAGFEHYEISNYAKPQAQARHNLAYWQGESYLGFGPSAHSFQKDLQKRWKNISSLHRYAKILQAGGSVTEAEEWLTPQAQALEKWMLALRLNHGFPTAWLATPQQQKKAASLGTLGLIESHPDIPQQLRLTPQGFAVCDQIIQNLA